MERSQCIRQSEQYRHEIEQVIVAGEGGPDVVRYGYSNSQYPLLQAVLEQTLASSKMSKSSSIQNSLPVRRTVNTLSLL